MVTTPRTQAWAALCAAPRVDLLVAGGGISGAGIALAAARRGLRVALVEAQDFAGGTSSRSSKLVHGGLRYLAQGQIGLTRESVHERQTLLREADGLVRPLRFVLPVRDGDARGRRTVGLGLALYDRLAGQRSRRWLTPAQCLERAPAFSAAGLVGAWSYLDAQVDDARLVQRVLAEAGRCGALLLNHTRLAALARGSNGEVCGATLIHAADAAPSAGDATPAAQTLHVAAACVVNATGAWADVLRQALGAGARLRPLRGSHLLLPDWRLPVAQALTFYHPHDRRPVYALPWEGATLVGTTDVDHGDSLAHEPGITTAEFDYLLLALRQAFPALDLQPADVRSTWSGVRPVVSSGAQVNPSKEPREHFIVDEHGLVTVTGGKLTTFRVMAEQALALASRRLPAADARRQPALAAGGGAAHGGNHAAATEAGTEAATSAVFAPVPPATRAALADLPAPLRARWLARYGVDAAALLQGLRSGDLEPVGGSVSTWAELRWACRQESVLHLDDLLLRRTRVGLLLPRGGVDQWPRLRTLLADELGWDEARWQAESAAYLARIARCYSVPGAATPTVAG